MTNTTTTWNPGLQAHVEEKQRQAASFRDLVYMTLEDIAHPVSVPELTTRIQEFLENETLTKERVRYALNSLVASKKVFTRTETQEERELRFEKGKVMAAPAALYSLHNPVPTRTQPAIGELLRGPQKRRGAKKRRVPAMPPAEKTRAQLQSTAEAIDYLVDKLVSERTVELQQQLNEANAKLASMRALLSK